MSRLPQPRVLPLSDINPRRAGGAPLSPVSGLVIVPTYNEAPNIETLVERILAQSADFNVLIVDDASPDGTGRIADELAKRHPTVQVLHRPLKEGLGRAYAAAFAFALRDRHQWIVHLDADLSHPPERIPQFLEKLADHDVVIGSRYIPGGAVVDWNPARHALSRIANRFIRDLTGLPLADATSGFKGLRRVALEAIQPNSFRSRGYAIQIEVNYLAFRRNLQFCEVPITFSGRVAGRSKLSFLHVCEEVGLLSRIRSKRLARS